MRGALETLDEEDTTVTFLRYALIALHGYLREAQVYDKVQESKVSKRVSPLSLPSKRSQMRTWRCSIQSTRNGMPIQTQRALAHRGFQPNKHQAFSAAPPFCRDEVCCEGNRRRLQVPGFPRSALAHCEYN